MTFFSNFCLTHKETYSAFNRGVMPELFKVQETQSVAAKCIKNIPVTTPCVYLSPSFPLQHMYAPDDISTVYGRRGTRLSPTLAAFVNGVAVSKNRWNRWVIVVSSIPDNFRHTKPISTTKLQLFCTVLWHHLGSQPQGGLNENTGLTPHCLSADISNTVTGLQSLI